MLKKKCFKNTNTLTTSEIKSTQNFQKLVNPGPNICSEPN